EFGEFTCEQRLAQVDVAEHAVERVGQLVVGGPGKERPRHLRPVIDGGDGQIFLAVEVMEKGPLGYAGSGAKILDRRCRVPVGANARQGRPQDLVLGRICLGSALCILWTSFSGHVSRPLSERPPDRYIPTSWYAVKCDALSFGQRAR